MAATIGAGNTRYAGHPVQYYYRTWVIAGQGVWSGHRSVKLPSTAKRQAVNALPQYLTTGGVDVTLFHLLNWVQAQVSVVRREEGQDLTEYALLLALIAVICIAGVAFLGTQISTVLSELGSALNAQL